MKEKIDRYILENKEVIHIYELLNDKKIQTEELTEEQKNAMIEFYNLQISQNKRRLNEIKSKIIKEREKLT